MLHERTLRLSQTDYIVYLLLLLSWLHGGDGLSAQSNVPALDTTSSLLTLHLHTPPPLPLSISWIDSPSPILQQYADSSLQPFYHGVASGDPLAHQVIIWTRITPEQHGSIVVDWQIGLDSCMTEIVQEGQTTTGPIRDYTVKVDVSGIAPEQTYFYQFQALGRKSPIGRTRTAPVGKTDHLRFAVASCANFQHGYFNAYARIAERDDLDAVLFLGDYLYEDGIVDEEYGPLKSRLHVPQTVLHALDEYRKRHAFYKLDPDLRLVHSRHPFIAIWDDHELIDDCHTKGSREHSEKTDGDWEERREAASRAYFEWMPVREPNHNSDYRLFRSFRYGNLVEIIMLDTRHEGRQAQLESSNDPSLFNSDRSMLGKEQLRWFLTKLEESPALWKIVGSQVVMSQIRGVKNLDAWDGYPVERDKILHWIEHKHLQNVVFVTGDVHVSIASDLTRRPFDRSSYDSKTGDGGLAVEFTAPSIASANLNELYRLPPRNYRTVVAEQALYLLNGHVKMAEFDNHGYFVLDITSERSQADWYFVKTIRRPNDAERWWSSWKVMNGKSRLSPSDKPSSTKDGMLTSTSKR